MGLRGREERACYHRTFPVLKWDADGGDALDLVMSAIADNLNVLVSTWWENEHVVDMLNKMRSVGRLETCMSLRAH